jgi:hypothetical protein
MADDTSRTIEIHASPARLLTLLAFSLMSTAIATALAFRLLPGMSADPAATTAGYTGIAFFGFCAVVALWRLYGQRGAMVTISPEGLRDVRVAPQTIPWRAVKGIATWQMQRQMVLVISIAPEAERRLTLTTMARLTRGAHRSLGADGLVMSAHGLKIGYPTLFYTCRDYWEAWRDAPSS